MRVAVILALLAAPAFGEEPLTGNAFERMVQGKTLTFSTELGPYGVEYYAANRQVVWSRVGGECITGKWYEAASPTGPNICFVYETSTEPQCWQVFDIDGQIRADFMNTPGTTVLYEAVESEPLVCGGVGA